jgi:hypothetical protein
MPLVRKCPQIHPEQYLSADGQIQTGSVSGGFQLCKQLEDQKQVPGAFKLFLNQP